jgi:hypothetical protein
MAVEAIIAATTPPEQIGRVSGWFQVGNLGGTGLGGGLGLFLVTHLSPSMAGTIMGALFMACCLALFFTPKREPISHKEGAAGALAGVRQVVRDLREMMRTRGGKLAALLCFLPIGTGAAQAVLTQAEVAKFWSAGADQVELLQGLFAGFVTSLGCFTGGWICSRIAPRTAYAVFGVVHAVVTAAMAASPATLHMYIAWSLIYAFAIGLSYAAFTAFVLDAMGAGSGATKYNVYASLSNFPIWWLGLLLGVVAQRWGARAMLLVEAGFGVVSVVVFANSVRRMGQKAPA